jgi:hypothetical protein
MAMKVWSDADTDRAIAFWREYQRTHDVSAQTGKTVGIDAANGRVWFGDHARDVAAAARADGADPSSMLAIRVGLDYYQRKGGRR